MENVFDNPKYYYDILKKVKLPKDVIEQKKEDLSGKSMLCAWLTKLCPAKCSKCFFKSNMYKDLYPKEKYELSEEGVNNLIKFINDSNNSYLMLSGGGEPMIKLDHVNKIIRETKTDRIVIVTSGIWAKNKEKAEKIIDELYESVKSRNDDTKVVLRLSIDEFHASSPSIDFDLYKNVFDIFHDKYKDDDKFILRVHTMQNDNTLNEFLNYYGNVNIEYDNKSGRTDNNNVIKIVPKIAHIKFDDGYDVFVGISKLFLSNIKADLRYNNEDLKTALDVFEKDMKVSEYSNPSVITNCDGLQGFDFWSDYNGNITIWGAQSLDNLFSIYTSTYDEIIEKTLDDMSSYSFLDKGYYYRRNIIKEINPRAVLRSEAINLRDYAGAFLMEENDTKLYYLIKVIKDYIEDGILSKDCLSSLPNELVNIILSSTDMINAEYKNSSYDILKQYLEKKEQITQKEWDDLFLLIKYGHYDIHSDNLQKALDFYVKKFKNNIQNIDEIVDEEDDAMLARLHDRISPMEEKALSKCLKLERK